MKNKAKVIAVVVTYNRKELLCECLDSLLSQETNSSLDVFVIDNASTDGTKEAIASYTSSKKIHYFNTGSNLGGAGGFEYGVREAAKYDCDYIWIMDDDTIPSSTALEAFIDAEKQYNPIGFLSSKALWTNGSICTMNVQRKNIMTKLKNTDFSKKIIPVEYATFVSLFVPMKIVKEVGAPIGEFFIWGDDWEFTRRISKKYRCYVVTNSVVIHKTGTNVGCDISNDQIDRIQRYKYGFRNEAFICKNEGVKGWVYRYLKILKNIVKVLVKAKSQKKERITVIIDGVKEGKNFNPKINRV